MGPLVGSSVYLLYSGMFLISGNINVRAAFIHVIGDTIQSVGVLVAAYIIKYKVRFSFSLLRFRLH